jgi:hypothetical protein
VAKSLNLEPRATDLMLNALTALGLLRKRADRFRLTDVSARYLKRGTSEYLCGMIRFDASLWRCWEQLPDAIRNGRPVRPPNMYQDDPAETETFIGAMIGSEMAFAVPALRTVRAVLPHTALQSVVSSSGLAR